MGAQMSGSIEITSGSEDDLQSAVANVGPLSVAVDSSNNAFRVRPMHQHQLYTHPCSLHSFRILYFSLIQNPVVYTHSGPCKLTITQYIVMRHDTTILELLKIIEIPALSWRHVFEAC